MDNKKEDDIILDPEYDGFDDDPDNDIIELIDDEDNIIKFKLFDVTEYKGGEYALLIPAEPNDEVADDEVVIFRFIRDEERLEWIDDDALAQEVFDNYLKETEDIEN